jgi:hypothetical protein
MAKATVVQAVLVTCELIGQQISDGAVQAMVDELMRYPEGDVLESLSRCRRELRTRVLTLSDVLDRMPGGHPGAEEAWAIVSAAIGPRGIEREDVSIVWTDEMREAFGVALPLGQDKVAARMAFKEAYTARVSAARANRQRPQWAVSLGYEPQGREVAVQQALSRNQISQAHAALLLPPAEPVAAEVMALVEQLSK